MSHALEFRGLTKSFGGARALDNVDFSVDRGEIHGLLGENGSGKSTLIKILAGYHVPDGGELTIAGTPVSLPLGPGQSRELNLSFVHQDLGLIPSLNVVDNLFLTQRKEDHRPWYISWRQQQRQAREILGQWQIDIDPRSPVGELSPMERALLAIVRAVEDMGGRHQSDGQLGGLLVLDEPTVYLPKNEIDQLFELLRSIAVAGSSIVFVSHDLDEALEITDRITVLRDGHVAGTVRSSETRPERLVELIIGRELTTLHALDDVGLRKPVRAGVRSLTGGLLRNVSLEVHEGEVLGLTGLAGSGFEDIPYLLYGAMPASAGTLSLDGVSSELSEATPARSLDAEMVLMPADRLQDGCVGSLSVGENIALPVLGEYFERGRLNRRRIITDAAHLMEEYDVRPRQPRMSYGEFSGGNQQKAMMARGLRTKPGLLLLHEPTQGVDVGARQNIFELIRRVAADGAATVCSSSDYEQLGLICDRVIIFANGEIVEELVGSDVTKERIVERCYATAVSEIAHG